MAGWTKTSGVSGTAAGSTLALGSIAAGQLIRCQVRIGAGGSAPTVSDDQDGSYTQAKSQADPTGDTIYEFYLYPTVNTGSRTITVSSSGGTIRIDASWFTPPTGTTSVSVSTSNSASGNSTSVSSGNVTAVNGDLVAGAVCNDNASGTGWTAGGTSAGGTWADDQQFNTAGAKPVYSQYVVATADGTFASAPTYDQTANIGSLIVVYAATAGGGGQNTINAGKLVNPPYHRRVRLRAR